ncbi:MAG: hypothetical protein K0V04_02455 [Deltaproteobacteria bacterium]|nr:hypothetical protein [Deltaproteobacteria bacterium]
MLKHVLLLGTLPCALLASTFTTVPTAMATEYESCELARQEYCYGEGNAFLDCYDESDADARATCFKRTVHLCETILVRVCEQLPGGSDSSGGMVSYAADCPPGTQPDQRGRCVARLQQRPDGPDLNPNDWCPPGSVVGPTDDCVPAIHTVRLVPNAAGGWGLVCPPGTEPGPVDGCVLALGNGGGEGGDESPISCPPGTAPGPDDGCIPVMMTMNLGNIEGTLAMDALTVSGALVERPVDSEQLLASVGVKTVGDPLEALQATAEALGADVADPGEPGAW